ncbi:MAG TPA: glucose 1-dehydrogenase [Bauldia sp.]|nr:glucose 1-dehydrogenase [Bauldia sp.]
MAYAPSVFDLFRLDGEAALITGAGAGIGRATALAFAEAGATVAVTDIDGASADALVAEIGASGGKARAWTLDVADEAALVRVIGEAAAAFGRLDVLVNNAGAAKRVPTVELDTADWRRVMDINITAAFVGSREAAKHMARQGAGRIVNVASIMGLSGGGLYPNAAYHASKGAMVNLTRALAAEWATQGIRVNAIAPTFLRTKLTEKLREDLAMVAAIEQRTPMGRFAEPEEIAPGILYLATRASAMVTGHTLAIDGGWLAI